MLPEKTQALFPQAHPVGSRVTCNPPPRNTDEDWLCYSPVDRHDDLVAQGFKREGEPDFYTGNDNGNFRSWRKGELNLIVTDDPFFYDKFLTATALAKRLNLRDKLDRIVLFQYVLYDVSPDETVPLFQNRLD